MNTSIRVCNKTATEHYSSEVKDGLVYYGDIIPGHENRNATGCMTVESYNQKCREPQNGWIYTSGCTHDTKTACTTYIIGQEIA